jgi:hypothetical protein
VGCRPRGQRKEPLRRANRGIRARLIRTITRRATLSGWSAGSGRLGEGGLHLLFVGEQLSHARPLLHPLEMRHTILELGKIEAELGASSKAPEEVRIDDSEMIEEPFAIGEHIICNLIVFE